MIINTLNRHLYINQSVGLVSAELRLVEAGEEGVFQGFLAGDALQGVVDQHSAEEVESLI